MSKPSYHWHRLVSARWEDAWEERLRFLGAALAITRKAGGKLLKLEAWCDRATAERLLKEFGGTLEPAATFAHEMPPAPPIRIRGRLEIRDPRAGPAPPALGRDILWIEPGTAFGTGAHATTAMLLRMLCDAKLAPGFRAVDAGTGSGILAMAMEKLGAARVLALDNDPAAVRCARANFQRNGCRCCRVMRADARGDLPPCDVITANLFSSLLIEAAPALARCLAPGGLALCSGLLGEQAAEVAAAMEEQGLRVEEVRRSGRWRAMALRQGAQRTTIS